MITVTTQLHVQRQRAGRKRLSAMPQAVERPPAPSIPRIARLMALAIKFQRMLSEGVVRDQSELARLARVTQPRMTQILNLNFLAPDIQEEILLLTGDATASEKTLRPISVEPNWDEQRRMWSMLCS